MSDQIGDEAPETPRGRFLQGQSGNPAGKPKGAKNRATQLAEGLMSDGLKEIVDKTIAEAKAGNMAAIKLVLDRIAPVRRGRPVEIDLPPVDTSADVLMAQGRILEAVANGDLTPEEGEIVTGIVDAKRKAIETLDIEQRLAALEQRQERQ